MAGLDVVDHLEQRRRRHLRRSSPRRCSCAGSWGSSLLRPSCISPRSVRQRWSGAGGSICRATRATTAAAWPLFRSAQLPLVISISSSVTTPSRIRNERTSAGPSLGPGLGHGHQQVVGLRLGGAARCRSATGTPRSRCGSGRRRRSPRPGRVHLLVQRELLLRVEAEEGRRPVGVDHPDQPSGAVGTLRPDDDAARLVRDSPRRAWAIISSTWPGRSSTRRPA